MHLFYRIIKLLAVERDVKPRNMNFSKVEKRGGGGGGAINREGTLVRINTVVKLVDCNATLSIMIG